jgi:hypothetical protein
MTEPGPADPVEPPESAPTGAGARAADDAEAPAPPEADDTVRSARRGAASVPDDATLPGRRGGIPAPGRHPTDSPRITRDGDAGPRRRPHQRVATPGHPEQAIYRPRPPEPSVAQRAAPPPRRPAQAPVDTEAADRRRASMRRRAALLAVLCVLLLAGVAVVVTAIIASLGH